MLFSLIFSFFLSFLFYFLRFAFASFLSFFPGSFSQSKIKKRLFYRSALFFPRISYQRDAKWSSRQAMPNLDRLPTREINPHSRITTSAALVTAKVEKLRDRAYVTS
jgi:hypothetical protein